MVVRAASRATILLQLSRLPSRGSLNKGNSQFISMNMTSRALDHLFLTRRWRNPSVKSGIRPTSKVMMVRKIYWPPPWQPVVKPLKYLTPSQKWKTSLSICSQCFSRAVVEEAMIWTIPCWMVERVCPDKNPSPFRNQVRHFNWWMDNSSSTVTNRAHRLMD